MAKSRIAPINKVSTPRMELNGAVLSKRCRSVITKEIRYSFEKVIHLVDSDTVLSQINKTSSRFQVYEGVRIREIHSATGGDMTEWGWIPGSKKTADWLTRGRTPDQINGNWQLGVVQRNQLCYICPFSNEMLNLGRLPMKLCLERKSPMGRTLIMYTSLQKEYC